MASLRQRDNRVPLYDEPIETILEVPKLTDIQINSFNRFLKQGIKEELKRISPIVAYGGKFELEFLEDYHFDTESASFEECKHQEVTYSAALRVPVRLINRETGEITEQEVFMSDIPMMSNMGTFLINGSERIVVSQFVRSPGVYFRERPSLNHQKMIHVATIIPNRGSWLEFENDNHNNLLLNVNKLKKVPVTLFLGALGYNKDEITKKLKYADMLEKTYEKHPIESTKACLIDFYKKLRPGDPVTIEGAKSLLKNLFFEPSKYDLSRVGRYRLNKRLEVNVDLDTTVITDEDIFRVLDYTLGLIKGDGFLDDIDHLGNRRVNSVGEQLQKQFRIGLARLERLIREQMAVKSNEKIVPQQLINIRPLVAVMREFFGSSQLSQFMDQTNPLAEIAHKRRVSALGPGGLTKERAGFQVRDIHPSHYGRICPIETPEGPNAGLIGPLATYGRVNEFGFIETPYR